MHTHIRFKEQHVLLKSLHVRLFPSKTRPRIFDKGLIIPSNLEPGAHFSHFKKTLIFFPKPPKLLFPFWCTVVNRSVGTPQCTRKPHCHQLRSVSFYVCIQSQSHRRVSEVFAPKQPISRFADASPLGSKGVAQFSMTSEHLQKVRPLFMSELCVEH